MINLNINNIRKKIDITMNKKLDVELKVNKSKKYINDSIWETNNFGKIKIIGKIDKSHYLVEFIDDGTQVITQGGSICGKTVKNPYYPLIYNIACLGRISQYHFLHKRWESMIMRIYDKNCKAYKNYGGRNIDIDSELLCFENYVEYISSLNNYNDLVNNKRKYDIDRINNDEGYKKGNIRIATHSINQRNTRSNNIIKMSKDNVIIDEDIIIRLVEKYPQYDLRQGGISFVVNGNQKSHRVLLLKK